MNSLDLMTWSDFFRFDDMLYQLMVLSCHEQYSFNVT
jgi:hypothetical protein